MGCERGGVPRLTGRLGALSQKAGRRCVDPADGPAGWHTYGLEWVPGEIRFFVDGRRTATHRKSDEGPGGWWPFDTIPEELRFALLLGDWAGTVDASKMPQRMEVDWVRGYRYIGPR